MAPTRTCTLPAAQRSAPHLGVQNLGRQRHHLPVAVLEAQREAALCPVVNGAQRDLGLGLKDRT
jgi:hypothetical protein